MVCESRSGWTTTILVRGRAVSDLAENVFEAADERFELKQQHFGLGVSEMRQKSRPIVGIV